MLPTEHIAMACTQNHPVKTMTCMMFTGLHSLMNVITEYPRNFLSNYDI